MITNALISTTGTTVFTATGNTAVVLMTFCNSLGVDVNIDVYVVTDGSSYGLTNKIISSRTLQGGDSLFLDTGKFLLSAGDTIYATSTIDNAVGATVSYIDI